MKVAVEKKVDGKWCFWCKFDLPKDLTMFTNCCVDLGRFFEPCMVRVVQIEK